MLKMQERRGNREMMSTSAIPSIQSRLRHQSLIFTIHSLNLRGNRDLISAAGKQEWTGISRQILIVFPFQ